MTNRLASAQYDRLVDRVERLSSEVADYSEEALTAARASIRSRLDAGETFDTIQPLAVAVAYEAVRRAWDLVPSASQILAASALRRGKVADLQPASDSAVAVAIAAYLEVVAGSPVHVVSVSDLASASTREVIEPVLHLIGASVGRIHDEMPVADRQRAYAADVACGSANEFMFDYLKHHMARKPDQRFRRSPRTAIVEDVEWNLVERATTPSQVVGRKKRPPARWYRDFSRIARRLKPDVHYWVDPEHHFLQVTGAGRAEVAKILGVSDLGGYALADLVHHLQMALQAKELYLKDEDYIVTHGRIELPAGAPTEQVSFPEGIRQAIEAKEEVPISSETERMILAAVTPVGFFPEYRKVAGIVCGGSRFSQELYDLYGLEVERIPSGAPLEQDVASDAVYLTSEARDAALIARIADCRNRGQPVTVCVPSIARVRHLSEKLTAVGFEYRVVSDPGDQWNAITDAAPVEPTGFVTIAAGPFLLPACGPVHIRPGDPGGYRPSVGRARWVVGLERTLTRWMDDRLRLLAATGGDGADFRFMMSFDDDLLEHRDGERIAEVLTSLDLPADRPIEYRQAVAAFNQAQTATEQSNARARCSRVQYDRIVDDHRRHMYALRDKILDVAVRRSTLECWVREAVSAVVKSATSTPGWEWNALQAAVRSIYFTTRDEPSSNEASVDNLVDAFAEDARRAYRALIAEHGEAEFAEVERIVALKVLDDAWARYLVDVDDILARIRSDTGSSSDPLAQYTDEMAQRYVQLQEEVERNTTRYLMHTKPTSPVTSLGT